ncbi:MAG: ABC transporter permease, partial [Gemmataceae bacterium]|nr:ABC transporter permease [Gemmataceae bacterium]
LMVVVTPAITAGALGHEKESDTLLALFGTGLTSAQIVIEKFIARFTVLCQALVIVAPILTYLALVGGMPPLRFALAIAQILAVTFALAGVCMLCSVWTRRTSDALLGCYSAMIIVALIDQVYTAYAPWPAWLNPFAMLDEILNSGRKFRAATIVYHVAIFLVIGLLCLVVSVYRLRPAALRQGEQRSGKWLWAFRRPIGEDSIRWREQHVFGVAALPWLRAIPRSLALFGTAAFALILVGTAIDSSIARSFFPFLRAGMWSEAFATLVNVNYDRVISELMVQGMALLVIGGVTVAARSLNSVTEEKRRKTWDDLAITPRSVNEILSSKRRGIFDAALPHAMVYAVPMVLMSVLAGWSGLLICVGWLLAAVVAFYFLSLFFMPMDVSREPTRPRSKPVVNTTGTRENWEYWERA